MIKHNDKNEHIKHKYLAYLEEAKRLSIKSADVAAAAIADFEKSTNYKDFKLFHIEQARKYKRFLNQSINGRTKKPLAKATIYSRLMAVKAFFIWLAGQPGYKSKISYPDCEYFNPSLNDSHIATAKRPQEVPTIEQITYTIEKMPTNSDVEKRNRALIAFTLLTGIRADAIASLTISNVDLENRFVNLDARHVRTKFRKSSRTTFFPVGREIELIVSDWIDHLTRKLLFSGGDPLFPSTMVAQNKSRRFEAQGLQRINWTKTDSIRKIFNSAFVAANLPYFNPHSFRHTLVQLGEKTCRTPEELKAWSQNLSHEKVLTTLTSYGQVSDSRQAELIKNMTLDIKAVDISSCEKNELTPEVIKRVLVHLQENSEN